MWRPNIKQCRFSQLVHCSPARTFGIAPQRFYQAMAKHREIVMILPYSSKCGFSIATFQLLFFLRIKHAIGFHKPELPKPMESKRDYKHGLIIRVLCHQPCSFSAFLFSYAVQLQSLEAAPMDQVLPRQFVTWWIAATGYTGISGTYLW